MYWSIEYEYEAQILKSLGPDLVYSGQKITELWFEQVNHSKLVAGQRLTRDWIVIQMGKLLWTDGRTKHQTETHQYISIVVIVTEQS